MNNAYAEARNLANEKAEGTTVFIPLSLLQALLAEIDRLREQIPKPENIAQITERLTKGTT